MESILNGQDFDSGRRADKSSGRGSLRDLPWLEEEGTFDIEIRSALHREGEGEHGPWAMAAIDGVTVGGDPRRVSFAVSLPVRGVRLSRRREENFTRFVTALGLEREDGTPGLEEPARPRYENGLPFYPQLSGRRVRVRVGIDGTRTDRAGMRIPTYSLEDVMGDPSARFPVPAQPPAAGGIGEALAPVFDRIDAAVRRAVGEAVEEAVRRVFVELRADSAARGRDQGFNPESRSFRTVGSQPAARPSVITMPDDLDLLDSMVPGYTDSRNGK